MSDRLQVTGVRFYPRNRLIASPRTLATHRVGLRPSREEALEEFVIIQLVIPALLDLSRGRKRTIRAFGRPVGEAPEGHHRALLWSRRD